MRVLILIAAIIACGLALGSLSARYVLLRTQGLGAINVGVWSAWPYNGVREADPYTTARSTIYGTIPLGTGEGVSFEATRDEDGNPLLKQCQYRLTGEIPITRLWTLTAYDLSGTGAGIRADDGPALFSGNALRISDDPINVHIGDIPTSGNWMKMTGSGDFKLVLRLYDTNIASNTGLSAPILPQIFRTGCPS